jgi:POT family proton-dependent oligopeptide transporter
MGINLGGFIAPLICGYLGERVGWKHGFGAAGVGMIFGLGLYLWGRDRYLPGIGLRTSQRTQAEVKSAAPQKDDGKRIAALAIVILFVIAFWSAFEQAGSSMNLFADKQTDRMVNGFLIPASWF